MESLASLALTPLRKIFRPYPLSPSRLDCPRRLLLSEHHPW
jgi:hypothetical protein